MKTKKLLPLALLGAALHFNPAARAVVPEGARADVVLGRQMPSATNMVHPYVAVDPTTQKIFVADVEWHRILRFSSAAALQNGTAAEAVLGQPDFTSFARRTGADGLSSPKGMWCDSAGRLWVADAGNNRVLRFNSAATLTNGAPAIGVLGQVNFVNNAAGTSASTLRYPNGLVTDLLGNLYVADSSNDRVLRFDGAATLANGASASCVLGQPNFTAHEFNVYDATHLRNPKAVALSPNPVFITQPYLWVADSENDRVLRFNDAPHIVSGAAAFRVLGQPDFASSDFSLGARGTYAPLSLAADSSGRLYVGCVYNRVLRFDNVITKTNNAPADGILGQAAFNTKESGSGPAQLDYPYSMALGQGGRLWIADYYNGRVMRHDAAHTRVNGADADGVLGAPNTTADMTRVFNPETAALDPVSGKLFVSDPFRHRVLRFPNVNALQSGAGAEAVFGQVNFSGGESGTGANRLKEPHGIAVDALGNLWIADQGNHRVLRFNNAAQRASGVGADGVLGQLNFSQTSYSARSATSLGSPDGIAIGPSGELWVGDSVRVLRFENAHTKPNGAPADGVLGQNDFTNQTVVVDAAHFLPYGLAVDATGRLWINCPSQNRLLRFDNAAAKPNGARADGVLGQVDFTSSNDNGLSADGIGYGYPCVEPNGRLWMPDGNKHRVLRWERAATRLNGTDADGLLGQVDFGVNTAGGGLEQFYGSRQILCAPSGHLWVMDRENQRILRFTPTTPALSIAQKNPTTVTFIASNVVNGVVYEWQGSTNLTTWNGMFTSIPAATGTETHDATTTQLPRCFFRVREQ